MSEPLKPAGTSPASPLTSGGYLLWFLATLAASFAGIVAFNALIDPLGVSPVRLEVPGVNLHKPMRAGFDRLVKPYDVARKTPRTLFMGSSLVKQSIDPAQLNSLSLSPAYNAGVDNGANLQETKRLLEHFVTVDPQLRNVYIELFLTTILQINAASPHPPVDPLQLQQDRLLALISGTAFQYSISTLKANRANLTAPSTPFDSGFVPVAPTTWRFSVNNIPDFLYRHHVIDRRFTVSEGQISAARQIIDECRRRHIDCKFFISPLHADVLYGVHFIGAWDRLVALKQAFARIAPTFDFTRYNDLIDERSGPVVYWWEAFHFSPALGAHMVRVMTGDREPGVPENFGVLLDAANVDAEVGAWTAERDRWIDRYPMIGSRFEAARNNNQKSTHYTGTLAREIRQVEVAGKTYTLNRGQVGSVEFAEGTYALGWAADLSKREPARAVAIFAGDKLVAYAEPNIVRPDISADSATMLGFAGFYAPIQCAKARCRKGTMRAFALYDDATAGELAYTVAAKDFGDSTKRK